MSSQRPDMTESERKRLETLYRRAADAEPDPGIDRMIRARAAAHPVSGHRRVLVWGGGLAAAACLVLAVGIGLQVGPPAPQAPPTPSMEMDVALPPESGARQEDAFKAGDKAAAEEDSRELSGASVTGSRVRREPQLEAEPEPQAEARVEPRDFVTPSSSRDDRARSRERQTAAPPKPAALRSVPEQIELLPPGPWLERIRELVAAGKTETAREMLEAFRKQYPDETIPAELEALFRQQSGD